MFCYMRSCFRDIVSFNVLFLFLVSSHCMLFIQILSERISEIKPKENMQNYIA